MRFGGLTGLIRYSDDKEILLLSCQMPVSEI